MTDGEKGNSLYGILNSSVVILSLQTIPKQCASVSYAKCKEGEGKNNNSSILTALFHGTLTLSLYLDTSK